MRHLFRKGLRVGFFSFTSCEGCQLVVLNCGQLGELVRRVEVVNFREATDIKAEDYQVAFVEGSITRKADALRLRQIRRRAEVVVALGACSAQGGINGLVNRLSPSEAMAIVYGKEPPNRRLIESSGAVPIDHIIEVDYRIHGCPIGADEFVAFMSDLIKGIKPRPPRHPVCSQCKMAGNICTFHRGMVCMGPVTRAGCNALCVSYGSTCLGCRGLLEGANIEAHRARLGSAGLTDDAIDRLIGLYNTSPEKGG